MLKLIFLLAMLTACTSNPMHADRNPAQALDMNQALLASGWQGAFRSAGTTHTIRLGFLDRQSARGEFEYFHAIRGGVDSGALGAADKACDFTPRAILLTPGASPDQFTGLIRVFSCAASEADEVKLEQEDSRKEMAKITVSRFDFSANHSHLEIEASIAGLPVAYSLDRQELDSSVVHSATDLHAWVVTP